MRGAVLAVGDKPGADDLGRHIETLGAQQQLGRVQRVCPIGGSERVGPQRQGRGLLGSAGRQCRRRQMPQRTGVAGLDMAGAGEIAARLLVPAGGGEKTAGVDREFERAGLDLACLAGVKDRPIGLPRDGKRAARMAMSFRPSGTAVEQAPIGRRRLLMALAIAEQPRAEIGNPGLLGLQRKGGAGAVDRFLAPVAVIERLAQPAIQRGALILGQFAPAEDVAAGIEIAGAQLPLKGGAICIGR